MNDMPVPLYNSGVNCYLNSGIQAISACSTFIREIRELCDNNSDIKELWFLCSLMEAMNNRTISGDISKKHIFKEWKKIGQQDSFELLAYVINQVYNEIKINNLRIGNACKWLDINLPLRIKMTNVLICKCGSKQISPLQTDIAFHLAFPNPTENKGALCLQNLLEREFQRQNIQNCNCDRINCSINDVSKQLLLYSPLSETICIHLQRLQWNGSKMKKNKDKVLFCNRITIKKEYLKMMDESNYKIDCYYFLKSVIIHIGEESYGHYICYKIYNGSWYYTSDTNIHIVSAQEVFNCNPYILFYECEEEWQVSPTIIKADNNLNIFINALSSCGVFINWLNKVSVNNDSIIIKRLLYLTDLANGNITRNINFEEELEDWCNKRDIYFAVMDILNEINYDISGINQDKATQIYNRDQWLELQFCLRINIEFTIMCKCGRNNSSTIQHESYIPLSFSNKLMFNQESLQLQKMFDNYFDDKGIIDFKCKERCTNENLYKRLKLVHPLPETIIIYLQRLDFASEKWINSSVLFCNKLSVKKKYMKSSDMTKEIKDIHYNLRSIVVCNDFQFIRRFVCYRLHNNYWYRISNNRIAIVNAQTVFNCNPNFLFYEREDEIQISPTIIEVNTNLNIFINAISSCNVFLKWLNKLSDKSKSVTLQRLLYLTNLSNGNVTRNKELENKCLEGWCKNDDIYSILKVVLKELEEEKQKKIENSSGYEEYDDDLPLILTFCNVNTHKSMQSFERIFRLPPQIIPSQNSSPLHLQSLLNTVDLSYNSTQKPKTICINLQEIINKRNREGYKILAYCDFITLNCILTKTAQGSPNKDNPIKYYLKAIISKLNGKLFCMRNVKNVWYSIIGSSVDIVQIDEVIKCDPYFFFYDITKSR